MGAQHRMVGKIGQHGYAHFKDEDGDDDGEHAVAKSFDAIGAFNPLWSDLFGHGDLMATTSETFELLRSHDR